MEYIKLKSYLSKINYKFAKTRVIGRSVLGKNIYCVYFEFCPNGRWAIVTAGIHAREHLSTDLVTMQITDLIKSKKVLNYNIAFVPLVNPDGADLVINGINGLDATMANKLTLINNSTNFKLFKANANGVDLNNNFYAGWNNKFTKTFKPSSSGFYGSSPASEPEVQSLICLTTFLNPFITISYHLKGEEIYFDFFQNSKNYKRDSLIAQVFAKSTGYTIKPTQHISSGGYKDWCVSLNIPALTIELGQDKYNHPYPKTQLKDIYNKNKYLVDCLGVCYNIFINTKGE